MRVYHSLSPQNSNHSAKNSSHLILTYREPIRLEQILADTLANISQLPQSSQETLNEQLYWTGASVFSSLQHPNKNEVLQKLNQLATQTGTAAEAEFYNQLQQQILNLVIGQRLFTPLDYDRVRINKNANPLVNQDLTLVLPNRPSTILVLGAVKQSGYQTWHIRQDAASYLDKAMPSATAENSYATVIQPDGNVEQHPIAYWNKNHHDIAPGSVIYLAFDNLPSGFSQLNDDIVNLLRNRAL
ncbi:hypothetical protein ABT56_17295 [Photobacterium aquae]|uniref:Uncharacterized protein n=2 Tax=Photobacterium aquae TaxID=1195763 RepID=A0A0J1GWK5_9GAMM|nr:hypothetical protein ABT56_17295 [Photobacterium aquae]